MSSPTQGFFRSYLLLPSSSSSSATTPTPDAATSTKSTTLADQPPHRAPPITTPNHVPSNLSYLPSPLETSTFHLMMSNQLIKSSQKKDHTNLTIETTNVDHLENDEGGIEVSIDAFSTPHQPQGNFSIGDISGNENIQPKCSLSRGEQLEIWKNERRIKNSHGNSSTRSNNTNSKSWYGTPSNNSSTGNFSDKSISSHKFASSSGGSAKSQPSHSSHKNSIVSQASATRRSKHHPKSLPLTHNHDNNSLSRPPINHHPPNHKLAQSSVPRSSIGTFLASFSRSRSTDTSKIRHSISNHSQISHKVESTKPGPPQLARSRRQSLKLTMTPSAPLESTATRKTWSSLECCGNYLPHPTNSLDIRNPLIVTKSAVTNRRCGSCQELSTMESSSIYGTNRIRRTSVGTNPLDRLSTKIAAQRCMNNSTIEHLEAISPLSPRQVIPEISFTPLPNTSIVTSPLTCDNTIHKSATTMPYFHANDDDDDNDDENSDDLTIGTESLPQEHSKIANWIEHISVDQSPPVVHCETNDSNEPPAQDQGVAVQIDNGHTSEFMLAEAHEMGIPGTTPVAAKHANSRHVDRPINPESMEQIDEGGSDASLHVQPPPSKVVVDPADGSSPSPMDDHLIHIRRSSSESTDPELMCIISSVLETESPTTAFSACIDECQSNTTLVAQENEKEIVDMPGSPFSHGVVHMATAETDTDVANNDIEIGATNLLMEQNDITVEGVDLGSETCAHIATVPRFLNTIACHTLSGNVMGRIESGNDNSLSESNSNDVVQMCPSPALIAPTLSDCTFQSHFGRSLDSFEDGLVQVYQGTKEEDGSHGTSTNQKYSLEDECPQLEQALQELEAFDWRSELISPVATLLPERRRTDAIELFLPETARPTNGSGHLSDHQSDQILIPSAETPVSLSSDDTAFNWRQELESPLLKPRLKRRKDSSLVPIPSLPNNENSEIANDGEINHAGENDCYDTPPSAENHSDPLCLVTMKEDDEQRFGSRSIEIEDTNIAEKTPRVDSITLSPLVNAADDAIELEADVPVMRLEGRTMLHPIQEDKSSILSVEAFNCLLIENRKLQNQVYDLRKSHDERLVPFREFLDEKRKLQVERVRIAAEQRANEEHLTTMEQKMTTAMQVSIQKIKFLQMKLLESKREHDSTSLELENAKLTIERLRDQLANQK